MPEQTPQKLVAVKVDTPKSKLSTLAQALYNYQANISQETAHAKTRTNVSGGGRKPWRQKGTGRARAGSTRSPLWRGGGVTFGPIAIKTRENKINAKLRRLALKLVLAQKSEQNQLFSLNSPVKNIKDFCKLVPETFKNGLLIIEPAEKELGRALNNHKELNIITSSELNPYTINRSKTVIISQQALKQVIK